MTYEYNSRIALFLGLLFFCATFVYAENIDPNEDGSQYAYGENASWINFEFSSRESRNNQCNFNRR